jgi:PAS domain S-box-containing protein
VTPDLPRGWVRWTLALALGVCGVAVARFVPVLREMPGIVFVVFGVGATALLGRWPGLTAIAVMAVGLERFSWTLPRHVSDAMVVVGLALVLTMALLLDHLLRRERGSRIAAEQLVEEERRARELLRASDERFHRVFEASQIGLIVIDPSTRTIESTNPAFARITGRDEADLVGMNPADLMEGGVSPVIGSGLLDALLRGEVPSARTESVMRSKTGELVYVDIVALLVENERGELRLLGTISDRTARVRASHAQRLEAVGRFAGSVAHDFNNLLTVVAGHASMLGAELPEHDPARADVRAIAAAADKATALTRQLLAFSRNQEMTPQIVDVNTIVRGVRRLLQSMTSPTVEIVLELEESLGPVRADPTQIEQVLMNLVVNARDAMPGGGRILIRSHGAELEADGERLLGAAPGSYVALTVVDTGYGMDATIVSRIFEPFFTTKDVQQGTGLGLATVYGIVRQTGGDISVESAPGEGSTFTIYLPLAVADPVLRPAGKT